MKTKIFDELRFRKKAAIPLVLLAIIFTGVYWTSAKKSSATSENRGKLSSIEFKHVETDTVEPSQQKEQSNYEQTDNETQTVPSLPFEKKPAPEAEAKKPASSSQKPITKPKPDPTPSPKKQLPGSSSKAPAPAPVPAPAPAPVPKDASMEVSSTITSIITLINVERLKNGLPPVNYNSRLGAAAFAKAKHMADNNYFAHTGPGGVADINFVDQAGYKYRAIGFNLAKGSFASSQALVDAWINSSSHRANILAGFGREVGIGIHGSYYVMMIAQPL